MVDRIKSAVNGSLAAKGFTEVPSGGDISIVAMETTRDQQTLDTFYNNLGGGWRWGGFGDATTTTENYKVGTLVIDLFDTNTKNLLWRGSASDTLSNKSEKNIDNLDKGVEKMFKKFPPEPQEITLVRFVACGQSAARKNGQPEKLMKFLSNSFEAEALKPQWLSQFSFAAEGVFRNEV